MQHSDIKGFTDQSEKNKAYVNLNKEAEERLLRTLEFLHGEGFDTENLAEAKHYFKVGFMLMNRAIFQPQRVSLPEDEPANSVPSTPRPAVYVGKVFKNAKKEEGRISEDVLGEQDQPLVAIGPHWYVKSEVDSYYAAGGKLE